MRQEGETASPLEGYEPSPAAWHQQNHLPVSLLSIWLILGLCLHTADCDSWRAAVTLHRWWGYSWLYTSSWFTPYLVMQMRFHAFWVRRIRWHTGCMRLDDSYPRVFFLLIVIWRTPTQPLPNIYKQHFNAEAGMCCPEGTRCDARLPNPGVNLVLSMRHYGIKSSPHIKSSYGGRQSVEMISYLRWCWNVKL